VVLVKKIYANPDPVDKTKLEAFQNATANTNEKKA